MSIENTVKFVSGGKMFVKESQEVARNIGFYVFTVRWVKPNYVALPVLSG